MPSLDVVVTGALELFVETNLPAVPTFKKPLVIGSGGALVAGEVMYGNAAAVFANESNYKQILQSIHDIVDGVVLVSASGSKHAVEIAAYVAEHSATPLTLITNNATALAAEYVAPQRVLVLPKNREPYTNNVSTYLGMILAATGEDPSSILTHLNHISEQVAKTDLGAYQNYTFILPSETNAVSSLIRIKFEEMFEPRIHGRAYGAEDIKHAKTVVSDGSELFISLGVDNHHYGKESQRLHISLPAEAQAGTVMAVGYFIVGCIQNSHPPYFKESIAAYAKQASEVFGRQIDPIVE